MIARDRKQGFFAQSFLAFSDKLISQNRIQNRHRPAEAAPRPVRQVEKQYGVPGPVIAAFWALESDYGAVHRQAVRCCGRSPRWPTTAAARSCFATELMEALRIIDRGDLTPEEMIGSWAGELGQTQFLPSHYFKHAVDYRRRRPAQPA